MVTFIVLSCLLAFLAAYRLYGRFLEKRLGVTDTRPTPAHSMYDGVDYVPARAPVLLGHHFSSIAGAGPIVGPVIAATLFGWLPALLWIVVGAVFVGGAHDFSALMASIRHKARSIAEVARTRMSRRAQILLLLFIWLALVYVLVVFIDLTSTTFVQDGGVATSSGLYIALAVLFGLSIYKLRVRLVYSSIVFVSLVFFAVWVGQQIPIRPEMLPAFIKGDPRLTWNLVLLFYCYVASVTPVWILLQPRDYLSSFLLYGSALGALCGIVAGGFSLELPAYLSVGLAGPQAAYLFPILFVTVACGACSGFHAVVASGTTAKQLAKESDARKVGYGAMLIEGLLGVIALATVMIVPFSKGLASKAPLLIYAEGMARFLSSIGLPAELGKSFALLAVSTFILTTLDTCTRLGRYVFQELLGRNEPGARFYSSLATLALPALFVMMTLKGPGGQPMPAWQVIWPVFGATNQLLAGLALLVTFMWLRNEGRKALFLFVPSAFMIVTTITALVLLIGRYRWSPVGIVAGILFVLALFLLEEAVGNLRRPPGAVIPPSP
jgi:carbon starvation protein